MLTTRNVILAKIEADYNTDPVPAEGTDAVLVENLSFAYEGARMHERLPVKPSLGRVEKLFGGTLGQLSFEVDIKGSGAAGTAPEYGPLLRACGFGETISAGVSVTYAPVSTAFESVTVYWYEDGLLHKLTGARGTVTGNLTVGQPGKLAFTITGHYSGPTDTALASPTYDAIVPVAALGLSSFAVDSFAAKVSALTFDMGLAVAMPGDLSASDGYGEIQIAGRAPVGTLDPLATLVADYDWVSKWQANTEVALDTGAVGATAGNIYQITMPKAAYREIARGDREGIVTREIGFDINEDSGDDEISIAFT